MQKIPPLTSKVDRMVPGEPCCPVAQDEILLNSSEKDRKYKCLDKRYIVQIDYSGIISA